MNLITKTLLTTLCAAVFIIPAAASAAEWKDTADAKLVKLVPAGFIVTQEARGDLNGDGAEDRVLLIKDADKNNVLPIRDDPKTYGYYDGNHYGVMAFFGGGGGYRVASENRRFLGPAFNDCELCVQGVFSCEIKKGVIHIAFSKPGRNWDEAIKYLFRYRDSDFELIGYDKDEIQTGKNIEKTSVNFPAGKRMKKSGGKEVWDKFTLRDGPIFMRKLKDDFWKTGFAPHIIDEAEAATAGSAVAGTFTDTRDGKKYKTVTIGGKKWFAENLNIKTGTSWCYLNEESKCKEYGRLYNWSTAAKMACPAGWRLPTREEWGALVKSAGGENNAGKKLKSKNGWNERGGEDGGGSGGGTDDYGFSALPAGDHRPSGELYNGGGSGSWWTSTEKDAGNAYRRYMGYSHDAVYEVADAKDIGLSVRCIADN